MAKVRFGVIGVGGMGNCHIGYLVGMKGAKLTAVCDVVKSRATAKADETGAKAFFDHRELIDSGLVDAVIVATPHYAHPGISMYAMNRGIHVISEKPLGVTLTPVDELIRTAKKTGVKFAVMYQQRTNGLWQKARRVIEAGWLGDIHRIHYIQPYYRCQAYYDADTWRATWAEEGGGVLVNQAPHATDLLWCLLGLPRTVSARVRTKLHNIEVEDEAEAMLEYPNGATGYYYTSTTEHPGRSYARVVGDRGTLEVDGGSLRFAKLKTSLTRFDKTNKAAWSSPGVVWKDVPYKTSATAGHEAITRNFINAINRGAKLISPGVEGINQVEVTCAMILSGRTGKPVKLPVDRAAYDKLLKKLQRTSKPKKGQKPAGKKKEVTVFT